jgi:hypothetical protein
VQHQVQYAGRDWAGAGSTETVSLSPFVSICGFVRHFRLRVSAEQDRARGITQTSRCHLGARAYALPMTTSPPLSLSDEQLELVAEPSLSATGCAGSTWKRSRTRSRARRRR